MWNLLRYNKDEKEEDKVKKKMVSLFLAFMMTVTAMPVQIFADTIVDGAQTEASDVVSASEPDSVEIQTEEDISGEEETEETQETEEAEEKKETSDEAEVVQEEILEETEEQKEETFVKNSSQINLLDKTEYSIVNGVSETALIMRNQNNESIMGSMLTVSPSSNATFKASYGNYYTEGSTVESRKEKAESWSDSDWIMISVMNQAAAYEAATGGKVLAAINADYFNMSTGMPLGSAIMEGNRDLHADNSEPYFAVLKDGTYAIRDGSVPKDDVEEAISGPFLLLDPDQGIDASTWEDNDLMPRQSIGLTADGKVVMIEIDGRQEKSVGATLAQLTEVLKAQGVVKAIYLDGGGSATTAARREGGELQVVNSPSDGFERDVSTALLIVATGETETAFDHVSISPKNKVYTPGSSVTFKRKGISATGEEAELPEEGLAWALAQESEQYGEIDENGVYTDNGSVTEEHKVQVQVTYNGRVIGSSYITIAQPDEIRFVNDSLNLNYEEESNLGLRVYNKGRTLNLNAGDIVWTIENIAAATGSDPNTKAGSFKEDGYTFVASANDSTGGLSVQSKVTATSKWDETLKAEITVGIGTAPQVVLDGGDEDGHNYSNVAYVHANPSGGGLVYETHEEDHGDIIVVHYINGDGSSRGGVASAESVDIDQGPVRFGRRSLKLNYDFTNINGTEGACVGFDKDILLTGSPTAIGIWVYAPEGTPNLWLRLRCKVRAGTASETIQTLNFTEAQNTATDGTKGGINWVGWKYLTCDLSDQAGPIALIAGETIRIMDVPGLGMGQWVCVKDASGNITEPQFVGHQKGSIYLDGMEFVFGNNPSDTDNPEIRSITAGEGSNYTDQEISADGKTVFKSNELSFRGQFADISNKNTTGIDFVNIYLDGVNVSDSDRCVTQINDGTIYLNNMRMANGVHAIKILTRDKAGNEAVVTRSFIVDGSNEGLTSVSLEKTEDFATLGKNYVLKLESNRIEDVSAVKTDIQIGTNCPVKEVRLSEEYDESYTYDAETGLLSIEALRKEGGLSEGEGTIAQIELSVPSTLPDPSFVTYQIKNGVVTYAEDKDSTVVNTFASDSVKVPVESAYQVIPGVMLVGSDSGKIEVKDSEGNPASGVEVYNGSELVGKTDAQGVLLTDAFTNQVQKYSLYAKGDDGYSFAVTGQSVASSSFGEGVPYHILVNASSNPDTSKNISWMAEPLSSAEEAIVQYAKTDLYQSQGEASFAEVKGTSQIQGFTGSGNIENNYGVRINAVTITGLDPETEYTYRVGDGEKWSEVKTFRTVYAKDADRKNETNFFVIGDTQAGGESLDNLKTIREKLNAEDYDFGVQLGDSLESPSIYGEWDEVLQQFSQFVGHDFMHVIGNHELYGDETNEHASAIYNLPSKDYYSMVYGNVYVATISYTESREKLAEAANWLAADAAASKATWKILVMHQPSYYTNPTGGSEPVNELLPPAIDQAGIDFVFSGHDHSYARTYPITNHELASDVDVEEMEEEDYSGYNGNGVVYYICGSTGEKSYAVVNNPQFHFARADQEFSHGIYLTVKADDESITVTTHDGDTVYDSFTKLSDCAGGNHQYTLHENGKLFCNKCQRRFDAETTGYTGFMTDSTGSRMYFINGKYQTGFQRVGNDLYLFDENGLGMNTTLKIGTIEYEYQDGAYVSSTDSQAGKVEFGFCGADASVDGDDEQNLIYAYQAGNEILNIGINPLKENAGGTMKNWSGHRELPWQNHRYTIRTVKIAKGVTNIGSYFMQTSLNPASQELQGLKPALCEVEIPGTVKTIGKYAFSHALNLLNVEIPKNVTKIETRAFQYIEGIHVTMRSKKALTIAKYAFNETGKLAVLTMPCSESWVQAEDKKTFVFTGKREYINHSASDLVTTTTKPTATKKGVKKTVCELCATTTEQKTFTLDAGETFKVKNVTYQVSVKDQAVTTTGQSGLPKTVTYGGVTYAVTTPLSSISGFAVEPAGSASIKLSWKKVSGAQKYLIYQYNGTTKKYTKIAEAGSGTTNYKVTGLSSGTSYSYRVRAYKKQNGQPVYSKLTSLLSTVTAPAAPKNFKAQKITYNSIQLKWDKTKGAQYYVVYRYNTTKKEYERIKVVKSSITDFTDMGLETGRSYTYKVRGYRVQNGKNYYGSVSKAVSAKPALGAVHRSKVSVVNKNRAYFSWEKVSGAHGYELYRSSTEQGTYRLLKDIKVLRSYTTSKYTKNHVFYYKVRAYRKVDGKKVYSSYSAPFKVSYQGGKMKVTKD